MTARLTALRNAHHETKTSYPAQPRPHNRHSVHCSPRKPALLPNAAPPSFRSHTKRNTAEFKAFPAHHETQTSYLAFTYLTTKPRPPTQRSPAHTEHRLHKTMVTQNLKSSLLTAIPRPHKTHSVGSSPHIYIHTSGVTMKPRHLIQHSTA